MFCTLITRFAAIAGIALGMCACIEYDQRFEDRQGIAQSATGGSTGDDGGPVVPAVSCVRPDEAVIAVQEFEYRILCGCAEPPWDGASTSGSRACTIATGMRVVWQFAGSLEHTVTGHGGGFTDSDTLLGGSHEMAFTLAGEYPYFCAQHPGPMSGYTIIVK